MQRVINREAPYAYWVQARVRAGQILPWLAGGLYLYTVLRGLYTPNEYAIGHWLHNYDYGFIKRGLVGALLRPVLTYKSGDEVRGLITVLSLVVFFVFSALLFLLGRRLLSSCRERALLPLIWGALVVFASSPFVAFEAHLIGYFDHLIMAATLASVLLMRRGRYVAVGLVSAAAVLIHEMYLLIGMPTVLLGAYLILFNQQGEQSATPSSFSSRGLVLVKMLAAPTAATVVVVLSVIDVPNKALTPLLDQMTRYDVISEYWRDMATFHLRSGFMLPKLNQHQAGLARLLRADITGLAAPAIAFFFGAAYFLLVRLGRARLSIVVFAVTVSPLTMHWVAWDTKRITFLAIFSAFSALSAVVCLGRPSLRAARPQEYLGRTAFGLTAAVITVIHLLWPVPLMNGNRDDSALFSIREMPEPEAYRCAHPLFPNSAFEHGTLAGWKAEGPAFCNQPLRGNPKDFFRLPGKQGRYWVSTANRPNPVEHGPPLPQFDTLQGKLVSMPFVITGDEMVFLVAGGKDKRHLTVALVVEGRTALRATGEGTLQMRTIRWDLTEHRGKAARIVITDATGAPQGNISADGFCYTDNPL